MVTCHPSFGTLLIFLTGFPGFLASSLVPHLLRRRDMPIVCLVQARFQGLATERAAALTQAAGVPAGRIRLVAGDVRAADLGLSGADWQRDVREIYHLAAVYDLGVEKGLAEAVNVAGTAHVLRFAQGCPALERFHYVSTCYVSGQHTGVFAEADLDVGQRFHNAYEETKFRAEVAVQQAMRTGLPATIYRPAIVVGDSKTGETQKYDGPYYIIRWLLRWGRVAPVPIAPNAERYSVNVVPRDFVVDALAHLSGLPESKGRVYQLCDPAPLSVPQMIATLEKATGTHIVRVPVSPTLVGDLLARVRVLEKLVEIEPEAFRYFVHPAHYTCANTLRDLEGSGIACPPFNAYVQALVDFVRAHPDVSAAAMA